MRKPRTQGSVPDRDAGVVTVHQLAEFLNVSDNTVFRMERKGLIPKAQRDHRGWRFWTQDQVTQILRTVSRSGV